MEGQGRAFSDHQLLLADLVRFGPVGVLAVEDATGEYDPLHLIDDGLRDKG